MKMVLGDVKRLYPLKENRYKLVGLLIAHIRNIVRESNKVDPLESKSFDPDCPTLLDDPVELAVGDYLDGKIG
ncbi:MAG: hypothetical protein ABII25_09720 [bacterium]